MNEIKSMEYVRFIEGLIKHTENLKSHSEYIDGQHSMLVECLNKFKSLLIKDYEPGTHGA
jgi:hemerythrin